MTLQDVDALPLSWLMPMYEKLVERREAEVAAIRRANSAKPKG